MQICLLPRYIEKNVCKKISMSKFPVGKINDDLLLCKIKSVHPMDTLSHKAIGEQLISGHYIEHTFLIVTEYSKNAFSKRK